MDVSVTLPDADVEFLDTDASERGMGSRSEAIHQAVALRRATELGPAYGAAREAWSSREDAEVWERTVGDGLHRRVSGVAPQQLTTSVKASPDRPESHPTP